MMKSIWNWLMKEPDDWKFRRETEERLNALEGWVACVVKEREAKKAEATLKVNCLDTECTDAQRT